MRKTTAQGFAFSRSERARSLLKNQNRGFTLIELLVVIVIIGVLAAIVLIYINPPELNKRSKDTVRVGDLINLQQAINVAANEATGSSQEALCVGVTAPCQGTSSPGTTANRKSDGSGWVKVNLLGTKSVNLPILPVDPVNNSTYNYKYTSDGNNFELNAVLESDQYINSLGKMKNDGGNNDNVFEVGSTLTLFN